MARREMLRPLGLAAAPAVQIKKPFRLFVSRLKDFCVWLFASFRTCASATFDSGFGFPGFSFWPDI
jgi:hypothetical protein